MVLNISTINECRILKTIVGADDKCSISATSCGLAPIIIRQNSNSVFFT